ncbi:MAG: DF family (seleno)protein [Anaerolineales bacterium]
MKIQLLYFDDCPSWEAGLKNLRTALKDENLSASIEMVNVADDDHATRLKFLGSPHFRVDGEDLWHEEREIYSLSCRVYPTPEGIKGFPTVSMLREQLSNFE